MAKSSKLAILAVGVAVAVAGLLAAGFWPLQGKGTRPRIEALASTSLGMQVSIGGAVTIGLSPGLRVRLADVHLRNGAAEVAAASAVDLGIELLPLLRQDLRIRSLTLKGLRITVQRDRNGLLNLEGAAYAAGVRPALAVPSLTATDVDLKYVDEASGEVQEAAGCSVDARDLLLGAGQRVDLLSRLSFHARLGCREARLLGVTSSGATLVANAAGGLYTLEPLSLPLFGGTGAGSIRADFRGPEPLYTVHYQLAAFRIEEFFRILAARPLAVGPMEFSTALTLRGSTRAALVRSASGTAELRGKGLQLAIGDLDGTFARYEASQRFNLVDVAAVFFAGPLGLGITKGYDFARISQGAGGSTRVQTLVSRWRVEHGVAHALDVAMATPKNRVALEGGLDFTNASFVDVTVALVDARGCPLVQQKVHGPFRSPNVEQPSVLGTLAGPTVRLLRQAKALFGGRCAVFYAGSIPPP